MFIIVLIFLAVLSIGGAYYSLRNMQKHERLAAVKKALQKERVLFHSSSLSGDEET